MQFISRSIISHEYNGKKICLQDQCWQKHVVTLSHHKYIELCSYTETQAISSSTIGVLIVNIYVTNIYIYKNKHILYLYLDRNIANSRYQLYIIYLRNIFSCLLSIYIKEKLPNIHELIDMDHSYIYPHRNIYIYIHTQKIYINHSYM